MRRFGENATVPEWARRQFVIAETAQPVCPGLDIRELDADRFLHFDPALHVSDSANGTVVGDAFEAGRAGRFARITKAGVSFDASGLRGLFFSHRGAALIVGSSPNLVAEFTGTPTPNRRLGDYSLNWHPTPTSGLLGVRSVLPGDRLDWNGGLSSSGLVGSLGGERPMADRVDVVSSALQENIIAAAQLGDEVWLPLTAGLDSRTLLAATLAADVDPVTFTLAFDPSSSLEAAVAKSIARTQGLRHETIEARPGTVGPTTTPGVNHALNADSAQVRAGFYEDFGADRVLLRGGCFEIGRRFFADLAGEITWQELCADPRILTRRSKLGPLAGRDFARGLQEWVRLRSNADLGPAHWIDLFYLDQRLGAWLAGIEMTLDAVGMVSIHPANDQRILAALTVSEHMAAVGEDVQRAVIEHCESSLLDVAFNDLPRTSRTERSQGHLRIASELVRSETRNLLSEASSLLRRTRA